MGNGTSHNVGVWLMDVTEHDGNCLCMYSLELAIADGRITRSFDILGLEILQILVVEIRSD